MKKIISSIFAFYILLIFPFSSLASFTDIEDNHQFAKSIQWMQDNGIINGYVDGSFRPERNISRAEFLKIFLLSTYKNSNDKKEGESLEGEFLIDKILNGTSPQILFSDVSENDWFFPYVKVSVQEQFISGYSDGSFKPHNFINFAEVAKIIGKETYCFRDKEKKYENWFTPYIQCLEKFDITGYTPDEILNRGQIADILARVYSMTYDIPGSFHAFENPAEYSKNIYNVYLYFFDDENPDNSRYKKIERANPQTFRVINSPCNLAVDDNYFYKKTDIVKTDIDRESYIPMKRPFEKYGETNLSVYGKDKEMFYNCNIPQPVVDVETVEMLPDGLYKDKNNVFFQNKKLEKLDSDTFVYIHNRFFDSLEILYVKDKNGYYSISLENGNFTLEEIRDNIKTDRDFYEYIDNKEYEYYNEKYPQNKFSENSKEIDYSLFENIEYDKNSLEYLSDYYAKDKNNIYIRDKGIFKIFNKADKKTFKLEKEIISTFREYLYSSDKNHLYNYTGEIVENINIDELEILGNKFFKDSDSVYSSDGFEMKNVDVDTFEPLVYFSNHTENYFSKDKNNIYYGDHIFIKKENLEKEGLSLDDFAIISNEMAGFCGAHLYYRIGKKYYSFSKNNKFLEKNVTVE